MTYLLAGDSTVATYPEAEYPMCGWGMKLSDHVDAPVKNFAICGATTRSFIDSGAWGELLASIRPGDTVLIQFGHNDEKEPGVLDARGGYTKLLTQMVEQVRQCDAGIALCTSTERRWFEDGRPVPTQGDYPNAVRDLGVNLEVPIIDLSVFTIWLYEYLGPDASEALLSHYAPAEYPGYPEGRDDDTHFRERGAEVIAAFVARSLRALERLDGDRVPGGLRFVK